MPTSPNLGLNIPVPSDNVNVTTQISDNLTKIDTAAGTMQRRVIWNGSSYPARPSVPAGMVEYVGPTEPTTWLTGDTWTPDASSTPPTVTGSRSDGSALLSLLTILDNLGIIVDGTTP